MEEVFQMNVVPDGKEHDHRRNFAKIVIQIENAFT